MVSNPNRELFYQSGIDKKLKIYVKEDDYDSDVLFAITNSQIHAEQFELTESVCSEKEMRFGCCESAMAKFRISNDVPQLIDRWLKIDIVINNDEQNPVGLGYFKVSSDNPSKNSAYRDVTAYDFMQDIFDQEYVTNWFNTFDQPRTSLNLRRYFGLFCGIAANEGELPNDNVELDFDVDNDTQEDLNAFKVMSAIAEINGCFVKIGRDRKMKYLIPKYEGDADGEYSRNHYSLLSHENFETHTIDYIRIISSRTGMDIHYPSTVDTEIPRGFNVYTIKDNFLLEGQTKQTLLRIAQNLYNEVRYIYYTPLELQGIGDPCVESGDLISVVDQDSDNPIYGYVFNRTLKGIQSLTDNIVCDGVYKYARVSLSVNNEVNAVKATTKSVKEDLKSTQTEVKTIETKVNTIVQNTKDTGVYYGESYEVSETTITPSFECLTPNISREGAFLLLDVKEKIGNGTDAIQIVIPSAEGGTVTIPVVKWDYNKDNDVLADNYLDYIDVGKCSLIIRQGYYRLYGYVSSGGGGSGGFSVAFMNEKTLLQMVKNVQSGETAEYTGETPTPTESGYVFAGWEPSNENVQSDLACFPLFYNTNVSVEEISDDWDTIVSNYGTKYPVGAYKLLEIGTVDGVDYGSVRMQKVYNGEDVSHTSWVSMDVLRERRAMNSTASSAGGWQESEMRSWLNTTVFNALPDNLKSSIVPVIKYSKSQGATILETQDALWIPSHREIFGDSNYESFGVKYENIYKSASDRVKREYGKTAGFLWWLRTVSHYAGYYYILSNGTEDYNAASFRNWFALGFCL